MARHIPRTNFAAYWRVAEAIRRDLRVSTGSPVAVRQAVLDLADLVAQALEEAAQVAEGLSMVVLAQHPDVTRGPRRAERATGATGRTARRRTRRGNDWARDEGARTRAVTHGRALRVTQAGA